MPRKPEFVRVMASGSRRDQLCALRDLLAKTMSGTESGRDIAALSRQLREVLAELEQLPAEPEVASDADLVAAAAAEFAAPPRVVDTAAGVDAGR